MRFPCQVESETWQWWQCFDIFLHLRDRLFPGVLDRRWPETRRTTTRTPRNRSREKSTSTSASTRSTTAPSWTRSATRNWWTSRGSIESVQDNRTFPASGWDGLTPKTSTHQSQHADRKQWEEVSSSCRAPLPHFLFNPLHSPPEISHILLRMLHRIDWCVFKICQNVSAELSGVKGAAAENKNAVDPDFLSMQQEAGGTSTSSSGAHGRRTELMFNSLRCVHEWRVRTAC